MTKEKLKKEAEVFAKYYESLFPNEFEIFYKAFLKVAEPREKQIAELEDKLANADYQLEGLDVRIAELEAQIEKMKKCNNCKHYHNETYDCREYCYFEDVCKKHEKWEMKEK